MASTIRLRVVCHHVPPEQFGGHATEFGLQDKTRVLQPGVPDRAGRLRFEFGTRVEPAAIGNGVRFSGPFVHGTSTAQFLYLGWRPRSGAGADWIRRWKISLAGVSFDEIASLNAGDGLEIQLTENGSDTVWLRGSGWTTCTAERIDPPTEFANEEH